MAASAQSRWNVRITFICKDNAHSKAVRTALEELGDKSKTDLSIPAIAADVRVLQVITKTVQAADETEVYTKAERRYAPIIELAEDWNCEIEAADIEEAADEPAAAPAPVAPAAALTEDEIALARERGDIVDPDPLSPDAVVDTGDHDYEDDLQATLQDLGPELLEIARERGWATADPLSPDFVEAPAPLTENEKTRLAGLVAEAIESSGAVQKQWYLWEIARQSGFDHLVRGIFEASGYDPIQFDDADFMGVAPGSVGLPVIDETTDTGGPLTVGRLIEQLQRFDPDAIVVHSSDDEGNSYRTGVDLGEGRGYLDQKSSTNRDGDTRTWHEFEPIDDEDAGDDDLYCVYVYPG